MNINHPGLFFGAILSGILIGIGTDSWCVGIGSLLLGAVIENAIVFRLKK